MASKQYVQVAFPIPVEGEFTYIVPDSVAGNVVLGSHVLASLGRRRLSGFVVGFEPREDLKGVKPLEGLVRPEPVFDAPMLELGRRVAERYLSPLGEILAAAYPGHADKRPRAASSQLLLGTGPAGPEQRISGAEPAAPDDDVVSLFSSLVEPLRPEGRRVFVLASADSEREKLYPHLAKSTLKNGGSLLILVPEVATSVSLVEALKAEFGARTSLFHSTLRISERKRIWESCRAGRLGVVVGTRSAVFLPLRNLRLIVVEDEHAQPYKQEETPRYNGRDVALMRAELESIPIVLASATPLVETYYALERKEYRLLAREPATTDSRQPSQLPEAGSGVESSSEVARPAITVVDMRDRGNAVPGADEFSSQLVKAIQRCLDDKRKVLLFLNRRGFSTYVQCQDCGRVETCPSCGLPLVLHSDQGVLLCHHCGYTAHAPSSCQGCKGVRFRYGGAGIEKVQTQLRKIFPAARLSRMDLDSVRTREEAMKVAGTFARGEVDILVGTLMVMKGFDFGEISLVGVLHAESQLNIPDLRSGERAFELLTEAVALAGGPGREVIIQTLNPDHHSVLAVASGNSNMFYEQELKQRKELAYPPFSTLVAVHVSGPKEPQVLKVVKMLRSAAASVVSGLEKQGQQMPAAREVRQGQLIQVLGPSPAFPAKSHGRYRWRMSIRGENRQAVSKAARDILAKLGGKHDVGGVTVSLDVDPVGA
jgi:primosomal protein N' (replication factor Y)